MKFAVGQRVLVSEGEDIVNEPATIKEFNSEDGYWCVFDRGVAAERPWVGLSLEETRLDPGWFDEEQLKIVE